MLQYKRDLKIKFADLLPDEPVAEVGQITPLGTLLLKFNNKMVLPQDV